MCQGFALLASPIFSNTGGAYGQESGHYRRQPDRPGRCSQGADSEGQLERKPLTISHKFPGGFSGVPLPETFPSVPDGPPHPGKDEQYHVSGVHQ